MLEDNGRIIHDTVNFEPLQQDTGFHLPTFITRKGFTFSLFRYTSVSHSLASLLSLESSLSDVMLRTISPQNLK